MALIDTYLDGRPVLPGGIVVAGTFEFLDNADLGFGTGTPTRIRWGTSDANANSLIVELPTGGAVDVPVLVLGIGHRAVDLGMFNGLTQPMFATIDADRDSYVGFHYSADDVAVIRMRLTGGGTVRNHTLPDVTSDTFAMLAATQTYITGVKTFNSSILAIRNPADTSSYTIVAAAILANRNLTLPLMTGGGTLAVLEDVVAAGQTFAGAVTLSVATLTDPTIIATGWTNANHAHAAGNSGGQIAYANITGRAVIRVGGNTTEATTTSITVVDLLSVASLSIGAATPFFAQFEARKNAGGAFAVACGLKLNATTTATATIGSNRVWRASATNQAESGAARFHFAARVTNYLVGVTGSYATYIATGVSVLGTLTFPCEDAAAPNATITDVVITGISGDAGVTLGSDELHIYTESVS